MSAHRVNCAVLAGSFNQTPFSPTLSNLFKDSTQFSPFPVTTLIPPPHHSSLSLYNHAAHLKTAFSHGFHIAEDSRLFWTQIPMQCKSIILFLYMKFYQLHTKSPGPSNPPSLDSVTSVFTTLLSSDSPDKVPPPTPLALLSLASLSPFAALVISYTSRVSSHYRGPCDGSDIYSNVLGTKSML